MAGPGIPPSLGRNPLDYRIGPLELPELPELMLPALPELTPAPDAPGPLPG
jgi:hypothetical protein